MQFAQLPENQLLFKMTSFISHIRTILQTACSMLRVLAKRNSSPVASYRQKDSPVWDLLARKKSTHCHNRFLNTTPVNLSARVLAGLRIRAKRLGTQRRQGVPVNLHKLSDQNTFVQSELKGKGKHALVSCLRVPFQNPLRKTEENDKFITTFRDRIHHGCKFDIRNIALGYLMTLPQ